MQECNREVIQPIERLRPQLAEASVAQQYRQCPEWTTRYGENGREHCLQDTLRHLDYLIAALGANQAPLFLDYIAWAKVMLAKRGIPAADLAQNLVCLRDALQQQLPQEQSSLACAYIESALSQLPLLQSTVPTLISAQAPLADLTKSYLEALLSGERQVASQLILQAVERGVSIQDLYLYVFQSTQHELGRLWQINQISVAQEHYCTAATQLIMSQLYAHIFATEKKGLSLVATCVAGDLHEIGMRMVADFFEMAGWDTYYLGANTPSASVVQTISQRKPQILAISATMSFHLQAVAELIALVRSAEEGKAVKIMVGGYPFNLAPGLWRGVGADGGARDAAEAIAAAETLVSLEGV